MKSDAKVSDRVKYGKLVWRFAKNYKWSFLSLYICLFAAIMVPVTFYIGYFLGKGEKELNVKRYNNFVKKDDQLLNSIQGWKEVKALTIEKQEERKFCKSFHDIGILEAWYDGYLKIPNRELMKEFEKALRDKAFGYVSGMIEDISSRNSYDSKEKEHNCKIEEI